MIILDTNVISEIMKPNPEQAVADWLDAQNLRSLHVTAINLMELRYGVQKLPDGKRKEALWEVLGFTLAKLFEDRELSFTRHAAEATATIAAETKMRGMNLGLADMQIAGIAMAKGFAVASRDALPFSEAGVTLIDPWGSAEAQRCV